MNWRDIISFGGILHILHKLSTVFRGLSTVWWGKLFRQEKKCSNEWTDVGGCLGAFFFTPGIQCIIDRVQVDVQGVESVAEMFRPKL